MLEHSSNRPSRLRPAHTLPADVRSVQSDCTWHPVLDTDRQGRATLSTQLVLTDVENRAVRARFLSYATARLRSSRRFVHAAQAQVLDHHRAVIVGVVMREDVQYVRALPSHLRCNSSAMDGRKKQLQQVEVESLGERCPSSRAWLEHVLGGEAAHKLGDRVTRRVQGSGLRQRKTLEAFDWDFPHSLDKTLILELARLGLHTSTR